MSTDYSTWIANIAALVFIYMVSVPLISYHTYRFYSHRSSPIMRNRDILFVLSLNCLIIFGLVTQRTLTILNYMELIYYPYSVQRLLSGVVVWGTLDLICIKSYLLFFLHRYHVSIQNASWKQCIDSSWNDWYLLNKNKWGTFGYLIPRLFVPYLITVVIEALGEATLGFLIMFIFHIIAVIFPVILVIAFSYRLGKFYDIYGIRKEIISQLVAVLICGVIYFISSYIVNNIYVGEDRKDKVGVVGTYVVVFAFSFVGFSSVYHPLRLLHCETMKKEKKEKRVHLLAAIKDQTMLSLFMQHSVREFNTENLLFIIETLQIKQRYQTAHNNVIKTSNKLNFVQKELAEADTVVIDLNVFEDIEMDSNSAMTPQVSLSQGSTSSDHVISCITTYLLSDSCIKIEIPSELPTSNIVTQHPQDIKSQIAALYRKYIGRDAYMEINIPHELREKLAAVMRKDGGQMIEIEGDWFWIMDEVCVHILSLLHGPFARFQQTQAFAHYVESKKYQTSIVKDVELINLANQTDFVHDGKEYEEITIKYNSE